MYIARLGDGASTSGSDSRTCLKESPATDSATDSHLLLPRPDTNFLSPDSLSCRRGNNIIFSDIPTIFHVLQN